MYVKFFLTETDKKYLSKYIKLYEITEIKLRVGWGGII